MSLRTRMMGLFGRKDAGLSNSKDDRIFWNGFGAYGHREFTQVSAALRAGFVLAGGMGMMGVKILDANGEEDKSSRAYNLLNRRPNDYMTGVEFRECLTLHAVFSGVGRAYIRRRGDGTPVELVPLHPSWSAGDWILKDGKFVLPISTPYEGYVGDVERGDVLEFGNPRWDIMRGLNVTRTCSSVLGLSTRLQDRQARLSDKNAPFGVITAKEGTSEAAIKKLKTAWVSQFGQSGIAVIDFEAQFSQLMQTPQDQQMLETMKFQVEEVARLYGVHPYLLMQTAGSGAQGAVSDVMLTHQVHGIGPWINRFEAGIEFSMLEDGHTAQMDETALMRTTPEARAEIYAKALGAGGNKPWMTENEVRSGRSPFSLPDHGSGDELAHAKEAPNEP